MKFFIDSNIFIYYFEDNPDFVDKIQSFFEKNKDLVTSTLVLKEICWYYEKNGEIEKLNDLMKKLLGTGIEVLNATSKHILEACRLKIKNKSIELNDLINYSLMKDNNVKTIFSTDKHFDRLPGITREF